MKMLSAAYSQNYYERLGNRNEYHKSNVPGARRSRKRIQRSREKREARNEIRQEA
jgi:hypothetical protein